MHLPNSTQCEGSRPVIREKSILAATRPRVSCGVKHHPEQSHARRCVPWGAAAKDVAGPHTTSLAKTRSWLSASPGSKVGVRSSVARDRVRSPLAGSTA